MSDESDLIAEIRAYAGVVDNQSAFDLDCDEQRIWVGYSGGSSSSLTLKARYDNAARANNKDLAATAQGYRDAGKSVLVAVRPMAIELRRERDTDVEAKREGVSVEWQSGDDDFDPKVYVASPTADARVLGFVLNAEVRAGVLALIALGFHHVKIDDDGQVLAFLNEFANKASRPDRGRRALAAFAKILANLPVVKPSGGAHPTTPLRGLTLALGLVGGAGWLTNFAYFGVLVFIAQSINPRAPEMLSAWEIIATIVVSVTSGVVGAIFYSRAIRARVRGTSTAHERVSTASFSAFGGVSVLVFGAMVVAIALADAR